MVNKRNRIGTVEGNSFCGKTVLIKELAAMDIVPIWEPNTYIASFPVFPPDNYCDAKKAIDIFAEVERRRSVDALNRSEHGKTVVMDRSLWTYMAFQYVVMTRMTNVPNSFLYSLDVMQRNIEDMQIIVPGSIISLVPENQAAFEDRVVKRGRVGIRFLNDWETTDTMSNFFKRVIDYAYKNCGRVMVSSANIKYDCDTAANFFAHSEYIADFANAVQNLRAS